MSQSSVSVRLDEADLATLDALTEAHDTSRTEIIRGLIRDLGPAPQGGAWVVGYHQEPPAAIFATEIEALRYHASGMGQFVKFIPWGEWS